MALTQTSDLYPSRISGTPEVLERKDPVVYGASLPGPLSPEQLDFFETNGYLFLEGYLNPAEVSGLQNELKRLWEQNRDSDRPEVIRELQSREVRSIFAVHRDNEVFQQLWKHPKLYGAAKQILGSEAYIHQSRVNFKPGFNGKEFYWHSDFETWHAEDGMPRMRAFSCSIALTDNYPFNGPLMVMPGSHRRFVSCVGRTPDDHYKDSLRKQEYGVPDHESLTWLAETYGIETPVGQAGSVLLFDCNLMHGSSSNISPYPRSNVFMVYNSVENRLQAPFAGTKPRPDFIAARE